MTTIHSDTDHTLISGLDPKTIQSLDFPPFAIGYNPAMDVFVFYSTLDGKVFCKEKGACPDYFFDKIYNHISGSFLHKDLDALIQDSEFACSILQAFDRERLVDSAMEVIRHYQAPERRIK